MIEIRIDKFLKNSRIIKRRTVAKKACEQGRVNINGKMAKPGDEVKVGDIIEVNFSNQMMKFEILKTKENVRKDEADGLYKSL